ncbi:TPA: hypothetical protein G8C07_000396 [Salmonella enterica]|nr:hypothetical protein [Salmonella enterica]
MYWQKCRYRCFLLYIALESSRSRSAYKLKAQKNPRRWFHDTAYCFDYSCLSHGTRSGT